MVIQMLYDAHRLRQWFPPGLVATRLTTTTTTMTFDMKKHKPTNKQQKASAAQFRAVPLLLITISTPRPVLRFSCLFVCFVASSSSSCQRKEYRSRHWVKVELVRQQQQQQPQRRRTWHERQVTVMRRLTMSDSNSFLLNDNKSNNKSRSLRVCVIIVHSRSTSRLNMEIMSIDLWHIRSCRPALESATDRPTEDKL